MRKKEVERECREEQSYEMLQVWKWMSNVCELNGKPLDEVDSFKYLGSHVSADGRCEKYVVHKRMRGIERGEH